MNGIILHAKTTIVILQKWLLNKWLNNVQVFRYKQRKLITIVTYDTHHFATVCSYMSWINTFVRCLCQDQRTVPTLAWKSYFLRWKVSDAHSWHQWRLSRSCSLWNWLKARLLVVLLEVKRNPVVCFKNHATTFALISVVDIVRLTATASVLAWIYIIYGLQTTGIKIIWLVLSISNQYWTTIPKWGIILWNDNLATCSVIMVIEWLAFSS